MDNRKRNYIFFSSAIVVSIIALRIAKALGITIQTGLANAILTIAFYFPIISFLLYLSSDVRFAKHWKIILRILAVQMALANIIGIIIFWFT